MAADPFAKIAEDQIVSPVKARMRAANTRAQRKAEKELEDSQILFRQWEKWHRECKEALLTGDFGSPAGEVATFLERMTLTDGEALVELIRAGPWRQADADVQFELLSMISLRIIFLREREGWPPFDDSLPFSDEAPTAFELIRKMLVFGSSDNDGLSESAT